MDPANKEIDPVAFALDGVRSNLLWIEEYRATFEDARTSDPETARQELVYLAHSTQKALKHMARLVELLLAGYNIDPSKRLPSDLARLAEPDTAPDRPGT